MDSANDQKSRDFERRFLPSVGLGFSGFIISLVLILVAYRLMVWLGFDAGVALRSAGVSWFVAMMLGALWPEKEPLRQYLETKALAYPLAGIVFGLALMVKEGWEWQYLIGTLLSLLVYAPAIFLRELSEVVLCYKL